MFLPLSQTQPMRLIYLLKMFPRFSETFILNELLELEAQGIDVRIYALKRPIDGKFHAELGRLRAKARYVPEYVLYALPTFARVCWRVARRKPGPFFSTLWDAITALNPYAIKRWLQAVWLADELKDDSHTGIHCHFAMSAPRVAYFLRELNGNPYTFTAHAKDIFLKSTKPALLRRKIARSNGVITVCDFNRRYIIEKFARGMEHKIVRIYNGVDLAAFEPADFAAREPGLILSVSRLVEKKGLHVLLDACAQLRDAGQKFRCVIAGEGALGASLKQRAQELALEGCVAFTGALPQEEVRRMLAKCTMLVAPSIEAGDGNLDALPTALLEALATATPVVTTPVTGIPEIVSNGEEGLLVPPNDAPGLAQAIAQLLGDEKLRRQMGASGRRKAERLFDRRANSREQIRFFEKAFDVTQQPLRIGYVLTVFPRLSETFILRELTELERLGAEVTVFSQKPPLELRRHEAAAVLRAEVLYYAPWTRHWLHMAVSHLAMALSSPRQYFTLLRFVATRHNLPTWKKFWRAAAIAREARARGIQLLHSHFISSNTRVAQFASQLSGIPYSATAHAKDIYAAGLSAKKLRSHITDAQFVATISEANRAYLEKAAPGGRVHVLRNSVAPDEFEFRTREPHGGDLRVLAIGRLVEKKGFAVLIDAVARVVAAGGQVTLKIAGDGPLLPDLQRRIDQAGIACHATLCGSLTQNELKPLFDWADALIVPSVVSADNDVDGVPVVILEAFAYGVPVIASDLSGIPEVVVHGKTGTLVPPGDAAALADSLSRAHPPALNDLAVAARAAVEREYDLHLNCKRLLKLMRKSVLLFPSSSSPLSQSPQEPGSVPLSETA